MNTKYHIHNQVKDYVRTSVQQLVSSYVLWLMQATVKDWLMHIDVYLMLKVNLYSRSRAFSQLLSRMVVINEHIGTNSLLEGTIQSM